MIRRVWGRTSGLRIKFTKKHTTQTTWTKKSKVNCTDQIWILTKGIFQCSESTKKPSFRWWTKTSLTRMGRLRMKILPVQVGELRQWTTPECQSRHIIISQEPPMAKSYILMMKERDRFHLLRSFRILSSKRVDKEFYIELTTAFLSKSMPRILSLSQVTLVKLNTKLRLLTTQLAILEMSMILRKNQTTKRPQSKKLN